MIRFACPGCGAKYRTGAENAGKTSPCRACKRPVTVPTPEEELDQLDEVPDELDQLDEVDEADELPEVLPADEPPRKKKRKRGLVVHGTNGSIELVGRELIFRHEGTFGGHLGRIREGTYHHNILGLTEIEFVAPTLITRGRIRFVFGNERLDAGVEYVLDTQTVEFGNADTAAFLHFKKEVERFKSVLLDEIRMRK